MRLIDADALTKEQYLIGTSGTVYGIRNYVTFEEIENAPTIELNQDRCKICERLNNIRLFEYYCPKCGTKMVEVKQ